MNNQLENLLTQLKEVLLSEAEVESKLKPLQKAAKDLKNKKEGLATEIIKLMKTDNYSTEFATIMKGKKLVIEIKDEEKAKAFMKSETIISIDEAKVEEMFNAMYREDKEELQSAEFDGIKVQEIYKPVIRKKKNGLEED